MRLITVALLGLLIFATTGEIVAQRKKAKEAEPKPVEPQEEQAQSPAETINEGDAIFEHYLKKYVMASRWNDTQVAKNALYDLIIMRPQSDSLLFTLAYTYFDNRQFAPAMLVSQDLLKRDSKNLTYLELSAASFESLGILDRALQNYETIYLLANNTMALYKIAFLQYDLKRYEEGLTNIDILLGKPDADTIKIGFNDTNNQPKDFPMKLALLNLKGMILEGKGDKVGSKKIYEDIVKQAPDFQPAVANLAQLNKK